MEENPNVFILLITIFLVFYSLIKILWSNQKNYDTIFAFLLLARGVLTQNEKWWKVSEYLYDDLSGTELFRYHKCESGRFPILRIYNSPPIYMLTELPDIEYMHQNSPQVFGPGLLKIKFFHSFMAKNIGVAKFDRWQYMRPLNEEILAHEKIHPPHLSEIWAARILNRTGELLYDKTNPYEMSFSKFSQIARHIAGEIVFGLPYNSIPPEVWNIFKEANTTQVITRGKSIQIRSRPNYERFIRSMMYQNKKNSPICLNDLVVNNLKKYFQNLTEDEILHQYAHWIFPILGVISVTVPRSLYMLKNFCTKKWRKNLVNRTSKYESAREIYDCKDLRHILLETIRLNNQVQTTFRTVMNDKHPFPFKRGDQIVTFNNPILRLKIGETKFRPQRWETEVNEHTNFAAIMFGRGNQRCPGKELSLFIGATFLVSLFKKYGPKIFDGIREQNNIINEEVPSLISPFKIFVNN